MQFKSYFIHFLKYIGKSVLASVLISLVGICLLTKTFPPDLGRLKNLYVSFRKLSTLSEEIRSQQKLKADTITQDPETEDKNLENLFEHRRQVQNLLSEMNLMKTVNRTKEQGGESPALELSDPRAIVLSPESYNNLHLQIKELTEENRQLRQKLTNTQK